MLVCACTGGGDDMDGGGGGGGPALTCEGVAGPSPHPRLVRLTHQQYDNSVRDLLSLDVAPSVNFLPDPVFSGFDNNAKALVVPDRLARDYRRAAESLAEAAAAPDALAALLPCDESEGEDCARAFIESFGLRAYRRPLTSERVDAYMDAFRLADERYDTGTPFQKGIRLVVEAMLQSPHFLYRTEMSTDVTDGDLIALDGYEVATRLSYFLWNSMPDDALLQAAAAGELDEPSGIEAQARRLVDDERARRTVDDFHYQWLHMRKYEDLSKDADRYPDFDDDTSRAMREETQRFIRHVIFELEGDYATLLTEPMTFVNQELAAIYGLEGDFPADDMVEVQLDANQRAGLLTQPGFLSSNAYFDIGSPIHRGVFVQRQILCAQLPDPPANIDTELPAPSDELVTTRDRVEHHTSADYCNACHGRINPAGFAFEHYDAVGAWRDDEDGHELDTTGTLNAGGKSFDFADAIDLSASLATNPQAQRCYLNQWFRYAYGRQETSTDVCTLDELDVALQNNGYNIKELLVSLTQTRSFRYRTAQEGEQ
ncbi:DUF1592 domain-containing protein [Haliangium sp.]|uniref:DUF1592 domain-containing protein n=1 Tax=Haliangium sp. TaxID=2663208 RepID=UPI003D0DE1A0